MVYPPSTSNLDGEHERRVDETRRVGGREEKRRRKNDLSLRVASCPAQP